MIQNYHVHHCDYDKMASIKGWNIFDDDDDGNGYK